MTASNLANLPRIMTERDLDMNKRIVKLAPSILSADFAYLGKQVGETEEAGADRIQVDIMAASSSEQMIKHKKFQTGLFRISNLGFWILIQKKSVRKEGS